MKKVTLTKEQDIQIIKLMDDLISMYGHKVTAQNEAIKIKTGGIFNPDYDTLNEVEELIFIKAVLFGYEVEKEIIKGRRVLEELLAGKRVLDLNTDLEYRMEGNKIEYLNTVTRGWAISRSEVYNFLESKFVLLD